MGGHLSHYVASFDVTAEVRAAARADPKLKAPAPDAEVHVCFSRSAGYPALMVELVELVHRWDRLDRIWSLTPRDADEVVSNVSRHPRSYPEVFPPSVVVSLGGAGLTVDGYRGLVRAALDLLPEELKDRATAAAAVGS